MDTISPHVLGYSTGQVPIIAGGAAGKRTPVLRSLMRAASRWKWVLLGGVLLGALVGILITALMTREYSSTVRLEITRDTARVVDIDSVQRDTSIGDQEFYQTQYGLLQTKELSERVVRELGLENDPAVIKMFGRQDLLKGGQAALLDPAKRAKRVEAMGKALLDHVKVVPVRGSRLVDVTAVTPDPELSYRIAQSWSNLFIETNLERRYEASDYARQFLEKRIEEMRAKLEDSERKAVSFAASQGIILLPSTTTPTKDGATGDADRSLVSDDLTTLNNALAIATAERMQAQSRLGQRADASNGALQNAAISQLREQRAQAQADYAKLMEQFEPSYPPAMALRAQINSLDSALHAEESRIGASVRQDYQAAVARESMLQGRVNALKGSLTDLRRRSIQYNIYQRDADTNRQLYNALLQRYKEIGVAGGIEKNNVSIADAPKVPDRPSSPNLALNLLLAMFVGGLAGAGVAGGLEQIDEGIADPAETEAKLGHPLLGAVPKVKGETPIEAFDNPRSPLIEAYLAIQATLELSTAHGTPRSLAVTSTRPKEGKSVTALALARSLARAHRSVVLVDADLRSPSVHSMFGLSNDGPGVSNFLAGSDALEQMLRETPHDRLTVMAAGPHPPNAADLLTGPRFGELIERLRERFDHVIVDSPPVIGLADAPLVGAAVDAAIYVVEARTIPAGVAFRALQRLEAARVNIIGIALTKFDPRHAHLGHGYGYGYEYSYDG